jgi:hypothetical protein
MSRYVNFSEEEIDQAVHTDIKSILQAKGEKVIRSGNEWAWEEHDSLKFRDFYFYQHSTGEKGTAIDFLCLFFNMSFQDAVSTLICKDYDGVEFVRSTPHPQERPVFFSAKTKFTYEPNLCLPNAGALHRCRRNILLCSQPEPIRKCQHAQCCIRWL